MKSDNLSNPNNTERTTLEGGSKQALNQKTSVQFLLSTTLVVVIIVLVAATAYYGLIH
ncbi:MAG: hypothetical protein RMY36_029735 [Nostoc sp. SerVER01]|nr:hypothetical protein [Nostoc sp. SerVER01]